MFSLAIDFTPPKRDILPDRKSALEAAARAVSNVVIANFRSKNGRTEHNRYGLPKSNYYADAADSVRTYATEDEGIVEIRKEGISLHYHGGTVHPRPGKRALAIPVHPAVATVWPSEAGAIATGGADDEPYHLIWPKGSDHGWIKDTETGDMMWLLVPKATIKADQSVLPSKDDMMNAVRSAVEALLT